MNLLTKVSWIVVGRRHQGKKERKKTNLINLGNPTRYVFIPNTNQREQIDEKNLISMEQISSRH